MPEQVRAARKKASKPVSEKPEVKTKKKDAEAEAGAQKKAEWDAIEADIDQALAEFEREETAESFVKAYRQKGGQ